MRMVGILFGLVLGSAPAFALADGPAGGGRRVTRCCLPRGVSVEFEAVPLAEALHRLLGDQNFALVYGNEGQLKSVRLLGGPQAAAAPSLALGAAPPPSQSPAPGSMMDAVAKHAPIPIA